jgi:hypothetical protein
MTHNATSGVAHSPSRTIECLTLIRDLLVHAEQQPRRRAARRRIGFPDREDLSLESLPTRRTSPMTCSI